MARRYGHGRHAHHVRREGPRADGPRQDAPRADAAGSATSPAGRSPGQPPLGSATTNGSTAPSEPVSTGAPPDRSDGSAVAIETASSTPGVLATLPSDPASIPLTLTVGHGPSVDGGQPDRPDAVAPGLEPVVAGRGPQPSAPVAGPDPARESGPGEAHAGCTPAQLRRFIKSRAWIPMHELRRRFAIDGREDDVMPVDAQGRRIFVGLPDREAQMLGDLIRSGEVGYELSLDPASPIVIGIYPMRPVIRN